MYDPPIDPKLEIESLVVETTRRCDMDCPHCLRGGPGQGDMPLEALENLLRQTALVDTVTFSGGEPALAIPVMTAFYEIAARLGVTVNAFFVATNGKANQEELALFALRQYERAPYPESCAVALSIDPYHDPDVSGLVRGLTFYSNAKEHPASQLDWEIKAGNAELNGIGLHRHIEREFLAYRPRDGGGLRTDTVYLSANGMAYPDCDLSYAEMDAALDGMDDCPTEYVPVDGLAALVRARYLEGTEE